MTMVKVVPLPGRLHQDKSLKVDAKSCGEEPGGERRFAGRLAVDLLKL